jgi:hypothetical protein
VVAASILGNLLRDSEFQEIIVIKLGALPDIEMVASWSLHEVVREKLTDLIAAAATR